MNVQDIHYVLYSAYKESRAIRKGSMGQNCCKEEDKTKEADKTKKDPRFPANHPVNDPQFAELFNTKPPPDASPEVQRWYKYLEEVAHDSDY